MNSGQSRISSPTRHMLQHARRLDIQIGVGLLVACVLPILMRPDGTFGQGFATALSTNSMAAAALAVVAGCLWLRRMTRYPGVKACAFVLPVFAFTYAITLFGCTIFNLPYSRFFVVVSFAGTLMWFFVACLVSARANMPVFAIMPFGDTERLKDIDGVRWECLRWPHFERKSVNGLIVDLRADLPDNWQAFVANTAVSGVPVHHVKQISEALTGQVKIEHLSENTFGLQRPHHFYSHVKRLADFIGATLLLPVLVPLFVVVAVIIAVDSPGPVFFRQKRAGYRGRPFVMWKFRTMIHGACQPGNRASAMTKVNDPRITRIGCFLRKSRIDELPQVINILKGQMSWIGPRPEPLEMSRWCDREIPYYHYRHIVQPGITGWAQVNLGHVNLKDDMQCKLYYDFYYIKNLSVWLDILIAFRTVRVMLTFFGAR